jgi:PAS domain S-box-containing protein
VAESFALPPERRGERHGQQQPQQFACLLFVRRLQLVGAAPRTLMSQIVVEQCDGSVEPLALQHNLALDAESEKRLHDLLNLLPAAVYTTDAAGRITFYNETAAALWGRRPTLNVDQWCGSWRMYWPDGTPLPHDQCPMAVVLKEGRAVSGQEAVVERPDGTRMPFLAFPSPLHDTTGEVVGAVNMFVDITARRASDHLNCASQEGLTLVKIFVGLRRDRCGRHRR